jgi:phospholipid N-methyltransferase
MNRKKDALLRLRSLRERNDLDAERHARMRGRFAALAGRGAWTDTIAVADNLFPTPPAIAAMMVEILAPQPGETILEPSAGTGRLLDPILAREIEVGVTAAELCPRLCQHLYEQYPGVRLRTGDFLAMRFEDRFDGIIMNPPFRRGTDVRHILHARTLLKPGGRLVALCYNGIRQEQHLRPVASTWTVLPTASFRAEGTSAGVVLLTMTSGGTG